MSVSKDSLTILKLVPNRGHWVVRLPSRFRQLEEKEALLRKMGAGSGSRRAGISLLPESFKLPCDERWCRASCLAGIHL